MSDRFPSMAELQDELGISVRITKHRIFNPSDDPKHATSLNVPYDLMQYKSKIGLTFLTFGVNYTPTKPELKAARNAIRRTGLVAPDLDTSCYPLGTTIVIELASSIENGFVVAVRFFGWHSRHNRWEDDKETLPGLFKCVIRGCQQIQEMIENEYKWIKKVIFLTDDENLIQGVTKIWDWAEDGVPLNLPLGLDTLDYARLNNAISQLEHSKHGTQVLFWKVRREYLPGVLHQVESEQARVHGRSIQLPAGSCGPCIIYQQKQELMFARTGNPCCPNAGLVARYGHLKKGDTFPLTNNAGVDAKVTMKLDGSVAAEALKKLGPKHDKVRADAAKVQHREDHGH